MQRLHCFSTSKHLLDAPRSSVLGPSFQLLQDLLQIYKPPTRKQAVMKALSDSLPSAHVYLVTPQNWPSKRTPFQGTKCELAINMLLVHEVR